MKSYKKTYRLLGELAEITGGYAFKSSLMSSEVGEYQIVKMSNLYQGNFDLTRKPSYWNSLDSKTERYLLKKDDILITLTGTVGKRDYGYSVQLKSDSNLLLNQRVCRLRPIGERVDSFFLFQYLRAQEFLNRFFDCSIGGTGNQSNVSITDLRDIDILLPPLPEQKAIAAVLSTWDAAIEKTERLIEAKERRFNWLLQKLILEPCRTAGWEKVKLGDVCKIARKEKLRSVEEHFLLTVKLHCLGIERNGRTVAKLTERGRPYFKHDYGDFLIGRQNFHNGGFGIVPPELDGGITSNAISCLLVNHSKLLKPFLWYQFSNANYYKKVGHIMDGTGQKELSDKQILELQIVLPSLEEQREIVETLSASTQEVTLQKQLLGEYKKQKRGLMQKLLTGEWRVNVDCGDHPKGE